MLRRRLQGWEGLRGGIHEGKHHHPRQPVALPLWHEDTAVCGHLCELGNILTPRAPRHALQVLQACQVQDPTLLAAHQFRAGHDGRWVGEDVTSAPDQRAVVAGRLSQHVPCIWRGPPMDWQCHLRVEGAPPGPDSPVGPARAPPRSFCTAAASPALAPVTAPMYVQWSLMHLHALPDCFPTVASADRRDASPALRRGILQAGTDLISLKLKASGVPAKARVTSTDSAATSSSCMGPICNVPTDSSTTCSWHKQFELRQQRT